MLRKIICIAFSLLPLWGYAQSRNTEVEISDYREVEGKIIVELIVNGERADFLLDLAGEFAVLPEYADRLKIEIPDESSSVEGRFRNKPVSVSAKGKVANVSFGNSVSNNDYPVWILADGAGIRELGVSGVIGGDLFQNVVLTIDTRRKKITTSRPYRPPYIQLNRRADFELISGSGIVCVVEVAGQTFSVLLDNTEKEMLRLTSEDYARLTDEEENMVSRVKFVRDELPEVNVLRDTSLTRSVIGEGLLKEGLLSIDYGRRKIYFQSFDEEKVVDEVLASSVNIVEGKLNEITRDYFIDHVYDYKTEREFVFKGNKPVVIDFWAMWCGPCMKMMPEMERLAAKYKDRVIFCKVNADKEKELCNILNVSALPTLFFIPVGGKPVVRVGALPEEFEKIIEEELSY